MQQRRRKRTRTCEPSLVRLTSLIKGYSRRIVRYLRDILAIFLFSLLEGAVNKVDGLLFEGAEVCHIN